MVELLVLELLVELVVELELLEDVDVTDEVEDVVEVEIKEIETTCGSVGTEMMKPVKPAEIPRSASWFKRREEKRLLSSAELRKATT